VSSVTVPVFLLQTVLFPGGHLPLRVFEQRYINMVRDCCASNSCFGVCLVNTGSAPGKRATHMRTGTLAEITDWSTLEDGLLGIAARGKEKFVIQSTRIRDNGLMIAEATIVQEPDTIDLPEKYSVLSMITGRFMEVLGSNYPGFSPDQLQDSNWIGYRLSELLPLDVQEKQLLLEMGNPLERLQLLLEALPRYQQDS
jgi:Lon protease-like protein